MFHNNSFTQRQKIVSIYEPIIFKHETFFSTNDIVIKTEKNRIQNKLIKNEMKLTKLVKFQVSNTDSSNQPTS